MDAVKLNWSSKWQATAIDKVIENFTLFRGDVQKAQVSTEFSIVSLTQSN